MRPEVLVAIITAVPTLVTAIVSVALNNRVVNVKLIELERRFDRLEEKVDKHNNFMERIARLEQKVADN